MKNTGYLIISILLISLAVLSCAEEEEGLEGVEAITSVKFIDTEKLDALNETKSSKSAEVVAIEARIAEIDADPNKGALLDEKDSLNKVKSALNEEIKTLNTSISNVNNGLIEVSSINSIPPRVNIKPLHTLYLNSNDTISRYLIIINDRLDTLDLVYDQEFQYVENQLKVIARGVRVNSYSYDTVTVSCKNCLSHDAQLTVYF